MLCLSEFSKKYDYEKVTKMLRKKYLFGSFVNTLPGAYHTLNPRHWKSGLTCKY